MYTFPVVEKSLRNIHNIEHIHPRKQRIVKRILEYVPIFSVFGSSVRWDCNEKSDLDILLDKNEIKMSKNDVFRILINNIDSSFDVLWKDEIENCVNKFQRENILNKSVKVYER